MSLDDINVERGLYGGAGIALEEWKHTQGIALERMSTLMARDEDIVLDDANCFRWLRDSYGQFARESGYTAERVFLDVPLPDVQSRIAQNSITTARRWINTSVFAKHVREFEVPQADETATVLRAAEDVSRWIEWTSRIA